MYGNDTYSMRGRRMKNKRTKNRIIGNTKIYGAHWRDSASEKSWEGWSQTWKNMEKVEVWKCGEISRIWSITITINLKNIF